MAYVDQRMSSSRIAAIVIVALLHALLGYAFVTGLAYNVIKKAAEDLKTFDVAEETPPPPEEPPPPPEKVEVPPPPVTTPPPLVRMPPAPTQVILPAPPPPITPPPPVPPPPPPPPAPKVQAARSKGSLVGLISSDDYPDSAARNEEQGVVRVRLDVGANGRVTNCTVVGSSGSSALDSATCRLLRSRARFTPAKDSNGNAVADVVTAPPIRWQLID